MRVFRAPIVAPDAFFLPVMLLVAVVTITVSKCIVASNLMSWLPRRIFGARERITIHALLPRPLPLETSLGQFKE